MKMTRKRARVLKFGNVYMKSRRQRATEEKRKS